jgi:hypothetical protein
MPDYGQEETGRKITDVPLIGTIHLSTYPPYAGLDPGVVLNSL